jgi:hypothetical protein
LDGRVRNIGSGRPAIKSSDSTLLDDLRSMLEGSARREPERLLCCTLKNTRKLAFTLNESGHQISHVQVSSVLHELSYSLQSNRKIEEGNQHADRDEQLKIYRKKLQNRFTTTSSID